jgi:predicted ribosomally synthesized peptide with nif11-like leader
MGASLEQLPERRNAMSKADLSRLLGDVRKTPHLLEELKTLVQDPDASIRWASEKGYDLDREDAEDLRESQQELTDDDLDKVAGGDTAWPPPPVPPGTGG